MNIHKFNVKPKYKPHKTIKWIIPQNVKYPAKKALLERLDLLLASQEAGHTGVRNELVSICDEFKRQGVLDTKAYKKIKLYY